MGANTINFREWLEGKGLLKAYIEGYLTEDVVDPDDITGESPMYWLNWKDWKVAGTIPDVEGCSDTWRDIEDEWDVLYRKRVRDEFVMGMPMNDRLGMALLLAELEDEDGKA